MPKILRDFVCNHCGEAQERYVDSHEVTKDCQKCGKPANRVIGMPKVMLDGTDPGFPSAYDKWASIREHNRVVKGKRSYARP